LTNKDCIYIAKGARYISFNSINLSELTLFYGVSVPAHKNYTTKLVTINDAAKRNMGGDETANKRVINHFIHLDMIETCQLSMGTTILEPCNVWNTMVFHLMGQPNEIWHIVIHNRNAAFSPSLSILAGCGTSSYAFIWAMNRENQAFDNMDTADIRQLETGEII
jgi:4-deoxy-L-threo-5-hexosulose-uronate ketol-isomerase